MKEYIVSVNDDDMDYEEVFISYIKRQKELIRCKDCKYLGNYESYGHYCEYDNFVTTGEEFCSWAERREE